MKTSNRKPNPGTNWKARALAAEARVGELERVVKNLQSRLASAQSELGSHDYGTGHPDDREYEMGM